MIRYENATGDTGTSFCRVTFAGVPGRIEEIEIDLVCGCRRGIANENDGRKQRLHSRADTLPERCRVLTRRRRTYGRLALISVGPDARVTPERVVALRVCWSAARGVAGCAARPNQPLRDAQFPPTQRGKATTSIQLSAHQLGPLISAGSGSVGVACAELKERVIR